MDMVQRLKYAREKAGLNGRQVKELTGIGESSLSEFESGKRSPSVSQLQALALAYQRSISFFFDEGDIGAEVVFWRERPKDGAEEIEARFLRLCEQYRNLEIWSGDDAVLQLPLADGDPARFDYPDAERLAKRVRDTLQLGDYPGRALLGVLEDVCHIKIFHLSFRPTGAAASTFSDAFGPAILLNSDNVSWRRTFDLAHELFHVLTHKVFRGKTSGGASAATDREEKLATCFARHLLMPAEATRNAVELKTVDRKLSFESLFGIARQFGVSSEALLWHLHFIFRRGPENEARTKREIERAKLLAPMYEERDDSPAPKRPQRFHDLAIGALRRGDMSIGRFAEYMGISRQAAARYNQDESAEYEEIEFAPA